MPAAVTEICERVHRIATYVPEMDFTFCQYLFDGAEPLLFHTGPPQIFDAVSRGIEEVVPLSELRWISFGHAENDECGAIELFFERAPKAEPVLGRVGSMLWMGEIAGRPICSLLDGQVLDTGAHRLRWIDTPQVPHGWDAGLIFDEVSGVLCVGDLFTVMGSYDDETDLDLVVPAMKLEDDMPGGTALTIELAKTIHRLADIRPKALAPMHAPVSRREPASSLKRLADAYAVRVESAFWH